VLDALTEVAFEPEFLPSRIEKERKPVVAEAQMMNTIEYRVDCQLLQYLHWENALGCRFPIGKTEQVGGGRAGGAASWRLPAMQCRLAQVALLLAGCSTSLGR
jgi:hypothetical protein